MHQTSASESHDSTRFSSFPPQVSLSDVRVLHAAPHASSTHRAVSSKQASPQIVKLEGWRLSTRMSPARFLLLVTLPYVTRGKLRPANTGRYVYLVSEWTNK